MPFTTHKHEELVEKIRQALSPQRLARILALHELNPAPRILTDSEINQLVQARFEQCLHQIRWENYRGPANSTQLLPDQISQWSLELGIEKYTQIAEQLHAENNDIILSRIFKNPYLLEEYPEILEAYLQDIPA